MTFFYNALKFGSSQLLATPYNKIKQKRKYAMVADSVKKMGAVGNLSVVLSRRSFQNDCVLWIHSGGR